MTQLVTGGSGYFGSVIVHKLAERGDAVRVFDLMDASDRGSGVAFMQGDIRHYDQIRAACDGVEVVYHCVAQVPLAKDKEKFRSVNIDGTVQLLNACADAKVRKVILLSSSAVYGVPAKNPVDDSVPLAPREAYGVTKMEAEAIARRFADEKRVDVSIIRPRTILGHGRLGIFQILFDWIEAGKSVYVLGSGANRYQFVHAEDLADACLLAAERGGFAAYNIGAAEFCTMRETLEGLIAYAKTPSKVRSLPITAAAWGMAAVSTLGLAPLAPYHWLMYGREMFFDLTRPMKELGWQPRWGNIPMICQSYDWYLANKDAIAAEKNASAHRSPVKQGILKLLKWLS